MTALLDVACSSLLMFSAIQSPNPEAPASRAPAVAQVQKQAVQPAPKKVGFAKVKSGKPSVKKLTQNVQKYYEKLEDFRADFIQIYTRTAISRSTEARGELRLKKPGKAYWLTKSPEEKHFVTNGKKLWVYEPEEEQVVIDPRFSMEKMNASIKFLWGQGKLGDSFKVSLGDPKKHGMDKTATVLELKPKSDPTYKMLVINVVPKTGQIVETLIYETAGNLNRFKFKNIKVNSGQKDADFDFKPPKNVEVVQFGR